MATPSAEELIAHTDWLLRLARALVGESRAGDLVQDTLEVALKKPPQRPGPVRPWLGGVARNLARMTTRSRVRREHREETAAVAAETTTTVPSPEELVARVQMQQRVAKLVLELHEPLRSTLLLRYFEGLDASEISRAQGVPAATVRSRLKDALDRIRATLDAEHGGDRRRWALVIAPVSAALPGSGAAVIAGGLVMKTSVKVLIGLVVAAVLVIGARFAGFWGSSPDNDDASKRAAIGSAGSGSAKSVRPASSSPPAVAASGRGVPQFHDDDPKGSLRLEGQVIDEHDKPVAKALVAIDANPPIVVESEDDGSFAFDKLIPRDYRLEATAGARYAGPVRLRLTDKAEPVTLRMKPGAAIEVTVTDKQSGAPINGAEIELRSTLTWKATTGANGVAKLEGIGAVWAPLAVRAPSYAPAAMMIGTTGEVGAVEQFAMTLSKGAAISGRVVDDKGKPIGGARVVPTSVSEPLPVVDPRRDGVIAGADGTFAIPAVAPGTWRLTATHGEFAPTSSEPITVDGVQPRTNVEIVLGAGAVVRGTVKDPTGKPVASASVHVVATGFVFWRARRQTFTDDTGAYAITGLARRPVDVVAQHETGASAIAKVDLAAKREHEVALVLDVSGTIEGVVVDQQGKGIGDAQVVAEPEWSGNTIDRESWVRGIQQQVTDQAGKFKFAGLPDGSYRVRAARPAASEATLSLSAGVVAKPNAGPIKIVVASEQRVIGKLQSADGKVPVMFTAMLGWTHPTPFASKDGAFALTAPPGTHSLTIHGIGFVELKREVVVAEGKDTDLGTLTVVAGRSVSGRVVDTNGVPVEKAMVAAGALLTGGGAELYIKDESVNAKDTLTDKDGRFTIEGFSPHQAITVLAGKADLGRSPSIRIPPGPDSATLDLVLAKTSGLDGKIVQHGKPLPDTVVIANPIGATASNFFVVTGPDGTFALDALAPGAYIIYPMLGGGGGKPKDMYMRKVVIELGKRKQVEIDATPGPTTLAITVKTDKGDAVPMVGVGAIAASFDPKTVDDIRRFTDFAGDEIVPIYMRIAMGGSAEIAGMRAGPHTVCAILGNPNGADPVKVHCNQIKIGGPKQAITLTVPAAWLEKKP